MMRSKSAINREKGKHQTKEQRDSILDAAEKRFLEHGLEKVKMIDIAAEAGINKVTLYRYFPNRDEIALEIHARMLARITSMVPVQQAVLRLENAKEIVRLMIRNFDALRDAYRYMGMFDSLYLDQPASAPQSEWARDKLPSLLNFQLTYVEGVQDLIEFNQVNLVMSTTTWFLEKVAMRGELTWSAGNTPLEEHLKLFEEMIVGYINTVMEA